MRNGNRFKLDDLRDKIDDVSDSIETLALETAVSLEDVEDKLDRTDAKVDSVQVKVDKTDRKIGRIEGELDRIPRSILASAGLLGLGFAAFGLAIYLRAPKPIPPASPAMANCGPEFAKEIAKALQANPPSEPAGLSAREVGEKLPPEYWIPKEPLPHQKHAPCDPAAGQTAINDGCWVGVLDRKPPCGRLYRYGDSCYLPVAEDPKQPVTDPHK